MTADGQTCEGCYYYRPLPAARYVRGECRRNAPRPVIYLGETNGEAVWPSVHHADWCGDWVAE